MITKYIFGCILIICLLVSCVGAADLGGKTIDTSVKEVTLKAGLTETAKTSVNISSDKITYTSKDSGISVTTSTKIDGVTLNAVPVINTKGEIFINSTDKIVSSKYNYFENGTIKETITLKEDKVLSFPIDVPKGYVLIPWYNGQYKIVESSMTDTMTGLVAEKPYGIDANGRYINMNYIQNGNILILNYNKTLSIFNNTLNKTEYFDISYPLIIDPTWTSAGGCWTATASDGSIIIKWNTTGTTTWTSPSSGVSSVWYLVVAGGGGGGHRMGGGGGGGGGLSNGTITITSGTTYTITVGTGGINGSYATAGSRGGNSTFYNITSIGGGGGGSYGTGGDSNLNGGSGGGSQHLSTAGSGTFGQGYDGGHGYSGDYAGGGGGGAGGSGSIGLAGPYRGGAGGSGKLITITDESIYYSGGGGGGAYTTNGTGGSGGGGNGGIAPAVGTPSYGQAGTNSLGGGGGGGGGCNDDQCYGGKGGSGVVILRYFIESPPISNFSSNVTSGTSPTTVQFTDTSENSPTSWQWTFGDTYSSNEQNPIHTYNSAGIYTVTLQVSNGGGTNTTTKTNYITITNTTPYAEFFANITSGMSPLTVQFTDDTNSSATSWNWTFGDGNFSNSQNPIYTFDGVGKYNVTLNVSNYEYFNITKKINYINVTASPINPTSYLNITPNPNKIYITYNGTSQLNARNITAKFIYTNISFNKNEVNILSTTNNFSVYPGLSVNSIYNNDTGFISMNISNSSGGDIIIGNTLTPIVDMRFKTISYSNGSAPLNFNSATAMLTTGDIEAVNTTVGGIITTADAYFTFNVRLINTATNSIINTVATVTANATNVTPTSIQTSTGFATFKANYTNVTFNVTCAGFYDFSETILIESENDIILRLTPLSGPGQSTWYSPHQVRITTISKEYGTLLVGSTINITPLTNTFPIDGTADYLVNVYGLNSAAANDMMNGTLIMNGITGSDGSTTFTMLSSIGYNINILNDTLGINHNVKIYPIENDYNIMIDLTENASTTMQDLNQTQLTYTAPNTTYGTFGVTYLDTSGTTTNVNFSVWNIDNDTMMYATDIISPGAITTYANFTIPVVSGEQYIWKFNATKPTGQVEYQRSATMKDYVLVSLGFENIAGLPIAKASTYYNFVSMGFLFLIGAMSSKRMTRFFALLIPIFAAMFVYLGWLQAPNPVATWSVIVMCVIMGAVTYMKGSLKENFGSGGPGSLLLNIVFYLIILQTCVGIVNSTGIWVHDNQTNSIATPDNYQMNSPNADLSTQVPTMTQSGGFWNVLSGVAGSLPDLAIGCIMMLLNIIISIALFSVTINSIFPFIAQTPLGLFMLAALQIGIWFIYAIFLREFSTSNMRATEF